MSKKGFYKLSKIQREELVNTIKEELVFDLKNSSTNNILKYASDEDTYIRKKAYLAIRQIYRDIPNLQNPILNIMSGFLHDKDELVRQTAVYTLGEIGKNDAEKITPLLEKVLSDPSYKVRNAIIGALKQMGEKNPEPTLGFIKKHLHHDDPEVRREMVHGIELRGRTHPEDVLPILEELQHETSKRVIKMIIHVLSQISYKKGCLGKVIPVLKSWQNQNLVNNVLNEILEIHKRYPFSEYSFDEAKDFIVNEIKPDHVS